MILPLSTFSGYGNSSECSLTIMLGLVEELSPFPEIIGKGPKKIAKLLNASLFIASKSENCFTEL